MGHHKSSTADEKHEDAKVEDGGTGWPIIGIACLLICLFIAACTGVKQRFEGYYWDFRKMLRKPGETSLALPDEVWAEYKCGTRDLPFVSIETYEVLPRRLSPGEEFSLRLIYSLCSNERADEISGDLNTLIYFQAEPVINNVNEDYSLKPGRWRVDTFINAPPNADPGVYAIETSFESANLAFSRTESFVVQ